MNLLEQELRIENRERATGRALEAWYQVRDAKRRQPLMDVAIAPLLDSYPRELQWAYPPTNLSRAERERESTYWQVGKPSRDGARVQNAKAASN